MLIHLSKTPHDNIKFSEDPFSVSCVIAYGRLDCLALGIGESNGRILTCRVLALRVSGEVSVRERGVRHWRVECWEGIRVKREGIIRNW